MKVIIQRVDLDTCLTGLIMDADESDTVICRRGNASMEDLLNPAVLCIEAGGSGWGRLNDFDHHNIEDYLPPACWQALVHQKKLNPELIRLARYVAMVDEAEPVFPYPGFPSLSALFSGMLLTEKEPVAQFFRGLGILKRVLADGIDPYGVMPDISEWRLFRAAKIRNGEQARNSFREARFLASKSGLTVGYLETLAIGGMGRLYRAGCDVGILFSPNFGNPPVPKFTIAGNGIRVFGLKPVFDELEPGWGGQQTIIGSPRQGTALSRAQVLEVVTRHL